MKCPLKFILFILLLILSRVIFAQKGTIYTIQGNIYDSITNDELIGVNVFFKDSQKGTVTDHNGIYTIEVQPGKYILVISYIGYQQKEIEITADRDQIINISLVPEITELDEVKITAQRRFFGNMEYGREIPSINAEVIERQNVNNASDILHARIAGVWATKTSGAPGDHQKIRIRGQNSFFSSAEPLYVVDGVPVPIVNMSSLGIADLNIHDIDNMTVLKDASSASLYGYQGGNGVVLIDTRRGGLNEIKFSVKTGIQWFNNYYDLLSAREQIEALDSAHSKMYCVADRYYPEISDTLCNRYWQDYIFSPGQLQEYQLSGSGNVKKFKYYLSGNYTNHQGIIPRSKYKRYTLAARLNRNFGQRIAVDLGYRGSYQNNQNNQDEYQGNRLIWEGIMKSPCLECTPDTLLFDEFYRYNVRGLHGYAPVKRFELPQNIVEKNQHKLIIQTQAISGFGRIQLSDHISMDIMESIMLRSSNYGADFEYYSNSIAGVPIYERVDMKSREDVILFNHQMNLTYYNTIGKHDLNFVLAHRFYQDNLWWHVDSMEGTLEKHFSLKNSMAAYGPEGSVLRSLTSYIGHASYNYDQRYFVSAIVNMSKIKEGLYTDYYTTFPSLALSWDIAHEAFFNHALGINNLQVFVNWGKSGNYPLNGLANDLYIDNPIENNGSPRYYPSVYQLANHHFKHESIEEIDLGIKTVAFSSRLTFSASYYQKYISNLILQRNIPLYYGGGRMFINVAKIEVEGVDLSVEGIPVQTNHAAWSVSFNYATSSQMVSKLDKQESLLLYDEDILIPEFIVKENQPIGDIYGYRYLGKWAEADWEHTDQYVNVLGSKFLNADTSDVTLTEDDKVVVGNSLPDFTWNLSNYFSYKNLAIEMVWYAAWGQEKYNATRAATYIDAVSSEIIGFINDSTKALGSNAFYESDLFVEDAGFIKLKNISFYYTLEKKLWDQVELTFSLSFENVLTITKYKGYDPEATIFTDNNFSDNSIDRGAYPNPRAVYVSISLKF